MSIDSATAVRRATKRLRPAANAAHAATSSGSTQLSAQRRDRGLVATAHADDDWPLQHPATDDAEDEAEDAEQAQEEAEQDSDEPPPILQSTSKPSSAAGGASSALATGGDTSYLRIPVPAHRYTPLKQHWQALYQPIVDHMKLQIRFNPKKRCIELRTSELTVSASSLHKSADFLRAFLLGFSLSDAIALLRLDDLYVESFEVRDVKSLHGEHLSRAIGRIAGQSGKTKFTIENATKTRIVLADTRVHVLGGYAAIQTAKSAIVKLIMGAPPGKVYTQLRAVANRAKERF